MIAVVVGVVWVLVVMLSVLMLLVLVVAMVNRMMFLRMRFMVGLFLSLRCGCYCMDCDYLVWIYWWVGVF